MSTKNSAEKFAPKSTFNLLQSIRDIPRGVTVWLSPEEIGRTKESVVATINRVRTEHPGEFVYRWDRTEQCFQLSRN